MVLEGEAPFIELLDDGNQDEANYDDANGGHEGHTIEELLEGGEDDEQAWGVEGDEHGGVEHEETAVEGAADAVQEVDRDGAAAASTAPAAAAAPLPARTSVKAVPAAYYEDASQLHQPETGGLQKEMLERRYLMNAGRGGGQMGSGPSGAGHAAGQHGTMPFQHRGATKFQAPMPAHAQQQMQQGRFGMAGQGAGQQPGLQAQRMMMAMGGGNMAGSFGRMGPGGGFANMQHMQHMQQQQLHMLQQQALHNQTSYSMVMPTSAAAMGVNSSSNPNVNNGGGGGRSSTMTSAANVRSGMSGAAVGGANMLGGMASHLGQQRTSFMGMGGVLPGSAESMLAQPSPVMPIGRSSVSGLEPAGLGVPPVPPAIPPARGMGPRAMPLPGHMTPPPMPPLIPGVDGPGVAGAQHAVRRDMTFKAAPQSGLPPPPPRPPPLGNPTQQQQLGGMPSIFRGPSGELLGAAGEARHGGSAASNGRPSPSLRGALPGLSGGPSSSGQDHAQFGHAPGHRTAWHAQTDSRNGQQQHDDVGGHAKAFHPGGRHDAPHPHPHHHDHPPYDAAGHPFDDGTHALGAVGPLGSGAPWPPGGPMEGMPGFPPVAPVLRSNKWVRPGAVEPAPPEEVNLQKQLKLIEERRRQQDARRAAAAAAAAANPPAAAAAAVAGSAAAKASTAPQGTAAGAAAPVDPAAAAAILKKQEEYMAHLKKMIELQEARLKKQPADAADAEAPAAAPVAEAAAGAVARRQAGQAAAAASAKRRQPEGAVQRPLHAGDGGYATEQPAPDQAAAAPHAQHRPAPPAKRRRAVMSVRSRSPEGRGGGTGGTAPSAFQYDGTGSYFHDDGLEAYAEQGAAAYGDEEEAYEADGVVAGGPVGAFDLDHGDDLDRDMGVAAADDGGEAEGFEEGDDVDVDGDLREGGEASPSLRRASADGREWSSRPAGGGGGSRHLGGGGRPAAAGRSMSDRIQYVDESRRGPSAGGDDWGGGSRHRSRGSQGRPDRDAVADQDRRHKSHKSSKHRRHH